MQTHYHHQAAFSMIELLIAMTIIAVVAGTAVPDLSSLLRKSEVKINYSLLVASLKLARNTAITSRVNVHVCAMSSKNTKECSTKRDFNANWSKGWLVFADMNNDNEYDADDLTLHSALNEGPSKVVFNQRGRLRFFPSGTARSAGFYLCGSSGEELTHLRLLHSGRTRIAKSESEKHKIICANAKHDKKL